MCWLAVSILFSLAAFAQTTTCNWIKKGSGSNGNQLGCAFTVSSGQERIYMIHLPQNFDPDKGLVFMYHGAYQNQHFYGNTGWFQVSDENGFAFVGAQNDTCETGWGSKCGADEAYSLELIEAAISNLKLNRQRIFLTGFSAGAVFTHLMASRHSDLFAAAAAYEGDYIGKPDNPYYQAPAGPVSILTINSTESRGMSYCGTKRGWWSADEVFNYWAKSAALNCREITKGSLCDGPPVRDQLGTPTQVTMKKASSCFAGTEVVFYALIGGFHRYYNDRVELTAPPGNKLAPYNPNFNSRTGTYLAQIIWNFFNSHPKRITPPANR